MAKSVRPSKTTRTIEFKSLSEGEVTKALGKIKTFSANYPKASLTPSKLRTKLANWQTGQKDTTALKNKEIKVVAVRLKAVDIQKLRAIHESPAPTAEAVVGQKMTPEQILGTLFSSLSALEFTKMEAELKTRMGKAKTPADKAKVQSEWEKVVKGAQQVFASAGLKNMKEADFRRFSQELTKNKSNFNVVVNIANSGLSTTGAGDALTGSTVIRGVFIPHTGLLIDPVPITTGITDLCSKPFAEGKFTKHFGKSFNLQVSLTVWCPTFFNPLRTCTKTFTLAGISFNVNVDVGYRVTCCGATAWGQGSAQACGTIVGITVCAGCTAQITGVTGIGRSTSGSNCIYGIGINASLTCKFGSMTVLYLQAPFGYNVTGPCPPAGFCK